MEAAHGSFPLPLTAGQHALRADWPCECINDRRGLRLLTAVAASDGRPLLRTDEPEFTRRQFANTAANAKAAGLSGPNVVPFVSLGAAYMRNASIWPGKIYGETLRCIQKSFPSTCTRAAKLTTGSVAPQTLTLRRRRLCAAPAFSTCLSYSTALAVRPSPPTPLSPLSSESSAVWADPAPH